MAAVRAGRKALELVAHDTEVGYLANNNERQLAIERRLPNALRLFLVV
jgi:hypothetical protein